MPEKVTTMVLKVDLQCHRCYKKVKKVLCKFPQVQDQIYNEKQNLVTIKVVCCCPEKIREKICCKGGRSVTSIEIKMPNKPEKKPKKPAIIMEASSDDQTDQTDSHDEPSEDESLLEDMELPENRETSSLPETVEQAEEMASQPNILLVESVYTGVITGGPCSLGYGGGPCFHGQGGPPPPCYGKPVYDSYGGDYFSEEYPSGCTIM